MGECTFFFYLIILAFSRSNIQCIASRLYIATCKLNMSENIFAMRGNIIDITLGIIAYVISIRFS